MELVMLEKVMNPASIAVIGASADRSKVGFSVLNNLVTYGYGGRLFPINPNRDSLLGITAFPSVLDAPPGIDLAIVCIPAPLVPQALRQCARASVQAAIIISAGFRETGGDGVRAENEIKEIIADSGIRVLGPNCLGVMNTGNRMNATFAGGMLPEGRLSFFSQSGALGIAVLDWAIGAGVGFSKFISLGNKADLNETDFIDYLAADAGTDVILGYIEDVPDGGRFLEVARRVSKKKPIILIKSGGTSAGARAASSHTGALAGSDESFRAAFRQSGVMRAESIHDLFETARVFSSRRYPSGKNLLIVTNAGGPGIMAADAAEKLGLSLPVLHEEVLRRLRKRLPGNASLGNPIDIIGDARSDRYRAVLREAVKSREVDGVIVILTPQAMVDVDTVAGVVIEEAARSPKPLVTSFMGQQSVQRAVTLLRDRGIPNFSYPEDAVRAFRKLYQYAEWRRRRKDEIVPVKGKKSVVSKILRDVTAHGRNALAEDEAREVLMAYGFSFPRNALATNRKEAATFSRDIGFPVVMKVASPEILHKTDVGGVRLGIGTPDEAAEAFSEITANARRFFPGAFLKGVHVYEMVKGGREVILGVTLDRTFGHMVMFGLGGVYVEVMKDVSFRVIPVSRTEARDMIREIRGYALLQGVRGEKPVNIDFIVEGIARVSQLVMDFPDIQELDLNPLILREEGALALDARIIIGGDGREKKRR